LSQVRATEWYAVNEVTPVFGDLVAAAECAGPNFGGEERSDTVGDDLAFA
jgi:hypothetical protein